MRASPICLDPAQPRQGIQGFFFILTIFYTWSNLCSSRYFNLSGAHFGSQSGKIQIRLPTESNFLEHVTISPWYQPGRGPRSQPSWELSEGRPVMGARQTSWARCPTLSPVTLPSCWALAVRVSLSIRSLTWAACRWEYWITIVSGRPHTGNCGYKVRIFFSLLLGILHPKKPQQINPYYVHSYEWRNEEFWLPSVATEKCVLQIH